MVEVDVDESGDEGDEEVEVEDEVGVEEKGKVEKKGKVFFGGFVCLFLMYLVCLVDWWYFGM